MTIAPSIHTPVSLGTFPSTYTVYTLAPNNLQIRYSTFLTLQNALSNLHPFHILPPLPTKQTLNRLDEKTIKHRTRRLNQWVTKCRKMKVVREEKIWKEFMDTGLASSQKGQQSKEHNEAISPDEQITNNQNEEVIYERDR